MILSDIIKKNEINIQCEIINEKEFETFGLLAADIDKGICSFLDNEKYIKDIKNNVKMLLVTKEVAEHLKNCDRFGLCITDKPRILFFTLHNVLQNDKLYSHDRFDTKIGLNCKINKLAYIAENNVIIGDNVVIEEFVSIKENTVIGNNCVIRAGTIIGGEGFEFKRNNNEIMAVKHLGGVIIGDNVEIQQGCCIDKAIYPWDNTVFGEYCKIDNLVYIAHGCKIGRLTMIASSCSINGRVVIGEEVWIGPRSAIVNGLKIGNNSKVSIGSVVTKSVEDNITVTGNFAIEHNKFLNYIKGIR